LVHETAGISPAHPTPDYSAAPTGPPTPIPDPNSTHDSPNWSVCRGSCPHPRRTTKQNQPIRRKRAPDLCSYPIEGDHHSSTTSTTPNPPMVSPSARAVSSIR
jgi:hypothetical protein